MDFGVALVALFFVATCFGLLLTSASPFLTWRFVREWRLRWHRARQTEVPPHDPDAPLLSILKPIDGLDDGLEENLASFARLSGFPYELILTCADAHDPACELVERLKRRCPGAPIKLVTGGPGEGALRNPKVARLARAFPEARGKLILISDSNVRIAPGDLDRTLVLLSDPSVGLVSNLFVGEGARTLGSMIESLHLLTFVVPGNVLAALTGYPCVVGKSMAFPREVLEEIGGLEAFAGVLAEDEAIAMAIHRTGRRVVLSPAVVRNVTIRQTLGSALARQIRWNRIRHSLAPGWYLAEVLMNPFGLALLTVLASAIFAPGWVGATLAFAAGVAVVRIAQTVVLDVATGGYLPLAAAILMPLKDALQLAVQAAPFLSREVVWHGHRARLGPGTRLVPRRRAPLGTAGR
jgi:ceramide glucosyltransferase